MDPRTSRNIITRITLAAKAVGYSRLVLKDRKAANDAVRIYVDAAMEETEQRLKATAQRKKPIS